MTIKNGTHTIYKKSKVCIETVKYNIFVQFKLDILV